MRIRKSQIRRELRLRGCIYSLFPSRLSPGVMRAANAMMRLVIKGRWLGKTTRMEQRTAVRPDGSTLRLCVCRSKAQTKPGATGLLWLHGGGYAIGMPEQSFPFIDLCAKDGGCVVVAPDYRLSVDAPYPAALEDAYTALQWLRDHAAELGVRSDQLFVGGDSAGGGLTAALCLYARDKGDVAVAYQFPLYPMLDDRETPSSKNNNAPVWNSHANKAAWSLYLRSLAGADVPPYAAPARQDDLRGMPPACTFVGDIEPFYSEATAYMERLKACGVQADIKVYAGCFHGFDQMCPKSAVAKEATAFLMERFRSAQASAFSPQP